MNQVQEIIVFHPSPFMVEPFNSLLEKEGIAFQNIVIPDLLERAQGGITSDIVEEVESIIKQIPNDGRHIVLCSCSTLGGIAESFNSKTANTIIRIDRPMAEKAIETGTVIGVAAALESTIDPTRELLISVAGEQDKNVSLINIHCTETWPIKQSGDEKGYIESVADCIMEAADQVDVVVLAQATMAPAAALCDSLSIPVFASPPLAIEKLKELSIVQ